MHGGDETQPDRRRGRRCIGPGSRVYLSAAIAAIAIVGVLGAQPAHAAFPGEPGPIAYPKRQTVEVGEGKVGEVAVEGRGGLYVHGPRRSQGPRQLTDDTGDHSPSYSRDGRQIVFVFGDESRPNNIYVMNSDGSGRRQVTDPDLGGSGPAFFPDGRRIAFAASVDGHTHIFTIRLDGSGLRQLTRGPHDDYDLAVSPDGERIAFVSDRDRDGRRDRSDIFSMRADGSRQRVLIDGPGNELDPDYGPHGNRIAFVSDRGRGASNLFVARANGRRVRRLTRCRPFPPRCLSYSHPAFSPSGRHIVALGSGARADTIEVLRSDGGGITGTFDDAGTDPEGFSGHLGAPTWGPRPRR